MQIVDVTTELIEAPAPDPPFEWRRGLPGSREAIRGSVRIITDEGVEGEARSAAGPVLDYYVSRWLRDDLIGRDPLDREVIFSRLWELDRHEEMPSAVIGAIDVALWDLAAKAAGLPLYRYLGAARTGLPAYASTATYGSIEEYLDVADQCLSSGFAAIKLHGWGDGSRDAHLCQAFRDHVGPEIVLMYDGSAAFQLPEAIWVGNALSEAGYLWYEEPMYEHGIEAYARLAERVTVPLLVGEVSRGAHWNMADFIASGCATYVRVSPHLKAGVTGSMRIAHLAEAFGLKAELHGPGPVQRHLAQSIMNTSYFESFVWGNPIRVLGNPGTDGLVHAPDVPGVGWDSPFPQS
jgi:L-alanine-DL-glutamate epimerase-like enolase superfamily enzyme